MTAPARRLPVLLLHGFLGSAADWDGVRLTGRESEAVDLPGHGAATGLEASAYTLEGAARHVLAAADAAGWDRFAVAGYSMGGRVALRLAALAPDRTAAVAAISAHPGLADPGERAERLASDLRRAEALRRDPVTFLAAWYDQPVFRPVAARPGLRRRLEGRHRAVDPKEAARAFAGFSTGLQEPLGERLAALGVPALLVSGALDPAYDRLLAAEAARHGFAHVRIDGAGHAIPLEQPARLAAALDRFLNLIDPCP